jgi:phosphoribosylformylglycinamidine synthase
VQVGDPFTEKIVIEACLELFARGLVVGVQDLGGAGLTCALTETAAGGSGGMSVDLDLVPLREPSMEPHEVLSSESQERMLVIVKPQDLDEVLAICRRWGVLATRIGEVTETGRLEVRWRGTPVVDVPPSSLADEGPVYERPLARPGDLDALQADEPSGLPRPSDLRAELLRLLGSPSLCSRAWVTDQYDRYVLGNTVLAQPEDAGIVRVSEDSGAGVALATDGNGRYCRLDPYTGAQLVLAEACRNVAATGAEPIAVTDCLNFGSPEDPEVMWQFAETCRGLTDACQQLGLPVTGGNVSFYNSTGDAAIHPTPVVGVLGVLDDVTRRTPMAFRDAGDTLLLLGTTREEFGGSAWAWEMHGHLGGRPPAVDLSAEQALGQVLITAAHEGLLSAAHDLSDGGLAIALVESCLRGGNGARIELPGDAFASLFSESAARAVVAVPPDRQDQVAALCARHGVPVQEIGVVEGDALSVRDVLEIPLTELRTAAEATLPAIFGPTAVALAATDHVIDTGSASEA